MNMARIAVVGTGSIGMRHLRVIRRMDDVRPVAIPKRQDRIRALEDDGFETASDLEGAAALGAKLCIVASDTGRHGEDSLSAFKWGLDTLVEKPLTTNGQEAGGLCKHAEDAGRNLFVGCVLRFSKSLNAFREYLHEIGRLHSVRIECQSYLPDWRPDRPYRDSYSARQAEGGALLDLIHEIDYAGWIFGWPDALRARIRNLGRLGIDSDESADLMWEAPGGCLVTMTLDYLSRPGRRHMRACGEMGTLEWDYIEGSVTLYPAEGPVRTIRPAQTHDEMFMEQACAFVKTSRGILDPRLATGIDGVRTLAICDAARRSSTSLREETVEYP